MPKSLLSENREVWFFSYSSLRAQNFIGMDCFPQTSALSVQVHAPFPERRRSANHWSWPLSGNLAVASCSSTRFPQINFWANTIFLFVMLFPNVASNSITSSLVPSPPDPNLRNVKFEAIPEMGPSSMSAANCPRLCPKSIDVSILPFVPFYLFICHFVLDDRISSTAIPWILFWICSPRDSIWTWRVRPKRNDGSLSS